MSLSYLDKTGLTALWAKIKAFVTNNSGKQIILKANFLATPTISVTSMTDQFGNTVNPSDLIDLVNNGATLYLLNTGESENGVYPTYLFNGHMSAQMDSGLDHVAEVTLKFAQPDLTYETVYVTFDLDNDTNYVECYSGNYIKSGSVRYINSTSGLTATNVQDAIDEVKGDIPTDLVDLVGSASKGDVLVYDGTSMIAEHGWYTTDATWIGYDNSNSGLSADYVGDAIDELASMISGGSDPQYARGDSVNLEDGVFAGSWYQPKTLFFFIPLPKGTANTGSVSISGKWLVRAGTGGRIIDNVALNTVGTVTVSKKATGVMVRVVLSTASTTYTTDQACTAYGSSSAKITFNT